MRMSRIERDCEPSKHEASQTGRLTRSSMISSYGALNRRQPRRFVMKSTYAIDCFRFFPRSTVSDARSIVP